MPGLDDLKKNRTALKRKLTLHGSKLKRLVNEKKKEDTVQCVTEIQQLFSDFHLSNEAVLKELTEEADIEQCEDYYIDVEEKYCNAVSFATSFLSTVVKSEVKDRDSDMQASAVQSSQMSSQMLEAINLPKLELCTYDGDPLQYHSFITAFEEMVGVTSASPASKLTRLVKSTSGEAHNAIKSCLIIGGKVGYDLAMKTLKERFGSDVVISQAVITMLRDGKPVRTASDLRALADVLVNSDLVLKRLSGTQEVQSQRFIASVVDRLQSFLKGKWKKIAMDMKAKDGKYPTFERLVLFV